MVTITLSLSDLTEGLEQIAIQAAQQAPVLVDCTGTDDAGQIVTLRGPVVRLERWWFKTREAFESYCTSGSRVAPLQSLVMTAWRGQIGWVVHSRTFGRPDRRKGAAPFVRPSSRP
jgi:hypothetical protein